MEIIYLNIKCVFWYIRIPLVIIDINKTHERMFVNCDIMSQNKIEYERGALCKRL